MPSQRGGGVAIAAYRRIAAGAASRSLWRGSMTVSLLRGERKRYAQPSAVDGTARRRRKEHSNAEARRSRSIRPPGHGVICSTRTAWPMSGAASKTRLNAQESERPATSEAAAAHSRSTARARAAVLR